MAINTINDPVRLTITLVVGLFMLSIGICMPSYAYDDSLPPPGECPQPRFTDKAPDKFLRLVNPLPADKKNLKFAKKLYQSTAKPLPCSQCHGKKGDGKGNLASQFNPPPRNFACAETVNGIPDGQLFWIIKNGSPGTSMPGFKNMSDEQIWQLVQYLRFLANNK